MSKINAVRLINLNYNNSAIRVSDEIFQLHGESTLLSLRNGGGKSVLVQMMMAPFVHKRYQNAKDRPFASYFTTNKPTFILVEWKLDQGAGYVLTGMMVRRNQEISEERQDELEMINFIAEYKERCPQDIYHLPVVEKTKKNITLKNFGACVQLFETYKRERVIPFFYYDMNNFAQSRQYFDKLMEYQIYYREWEAIIKKVNLKESGLSDLFADCRDEKGLVEKWFLEAVENKLNQEKNRMKEFQGIMEKYTGQYKENQSKIQRRDTIRAFGQEAELVRENAFRYRDVSAAVEGQKARIGDFIRRLHEMEEQEKRNAEATSLQMEDLSQRMEHLEYEKLSGELYQITDRERSAVSNLEMLRIEEEDLERVREGVAHTLHVLACAKQHENVAECREERDRELQRLLLCREKSENLEPERKRLGAQLQAYYEALGAQKEQEKQQCLDSVRHMEQSMEEGQRKSEELLATERGLAEQAGALNERIRMFDGTEERFNQEYHEEWNRNLLGQYEAAALEIRQAEYEKELNNSEHAKAAAKKEVELHREQLKSQRRLLEDRVAWKSQLEAAIKETESLVQEYERELTERSVILRYFELGQESLFDTEKILEAVQRKLLDTDGNRQKMEREADALEKEYRRAAQGQVLELSEEFRGLLEEAGIHYVYGCEWLRKNQFPEERNRQLVEEQPFLPYALLLSRQDLKRLSELPEPISTSFPVPILLREELEQGTKAQQGAVCTLENASLNVQKVHFYVWFNRNLLDEEKLKQMLLEQEVRIHKLRKAIETKKTEYAEYTGQQEKLKSQKVSRSAYETAKEEEDRQEKERAALEQELLSRREELETLEEYQTQKEQRVAELEKEIFYQNRRLGDFSRFCRAYREYREHCRLLEKNQEEQERVRHLQKLEKDKIDKLNQKLISERNRLTTLEREGEECAEKQARYRQYAPKEEKVVPTQEATFSQEATPTQEAASSQEATPTQEATPAQDGTPAQESLFSAEKAREAECRYEAITSGISLEQTELEKRAETAEKRYGRAMEELKSLMEKYHLAEEEWSGTVYDKKEERHQESLLEEQERRIGRKRKLIHQEEIQCALLQQERERKRIQMEERCRKKEPMARAEIQTIDFEEALRKLEYEREETQKEEVRIQKKLQGYESNLTALAEYEELICEEPVTWEVELSALSGAELTKQKGILLRDYNAYQEQHREARLSLERVLNRMIRMEAFAEDFYQKPLESMLQLAYDAERVIRQLETTLASYENLMEKLQVDISLVEKEKARIVELVGDYLREVHEDLNKIDRNSTITVREHSVKMLKIDLPDWTENQELYDLRLQDYLGDVTAKGITLLEENQNVQEFLGTKITTKGLYDAVVGIGNVQIRLYKIEAQREYPITWTDVARNSGGEGFLSAFVILAALLCYMRRDEADIFSDRNEGKVLLMDNPFAQTNAAHLLKPLMDMAKKANTQLICLSGLGGESIYNCFDNIYVLTLIAANLRNDMQYLKAEHMRGSEEETMLVSQIEVLEQQEFLF